MIRLYQYSLAGLLGGQCRFVPSCSHYAVDAVRLRGFFVGIWLAAGRIARCHPWSPGGFDPVVVTRGHRCPKSVFVERDE